MISSYRPTKPTTSTSLDSAFGVHFRRLSPAVSDSWRESSSPIAIVVPTARGATPTRLRTAFPSNGRIRQDLAVGSVTPNGRILKRSRLSAWSVDSSISLLESSRILLHLNEIVV